MTPPASHWSDALKVGDRLLLSEGGVSREERIVEVTAIHKLHVVIGEPPRQRKFRRAGDWMREAGEHSGWGARATVRRLKPEDEKRVRVRHNLHRICGVVWRDVAPEAIAKVLTVLDAEQTKEGDR